VKKPYLVSVSLLLVAMMVLPVLLSGCSKPTQRTTSTQPTSTVNPTTSFVMHNFLSELQQKSFLKARFFGVMTFSFSGTAFTYPTEFTVASVPIVWMALIFDGKLEETGAGEDVTDQIHGSISQDGQWITDMYFSRRITYINNNTGIFYQVTLHNVPLGGLDTTQTPGSAIADREGDVQKYITQIDYQNGPLVNGQINATTTYMSTDWKNMKTGMIPVLKLTFETQPSEILGPTIPQAGMGMGR